VLPFVVTLHFEPSQYEEDNPTQRPPSPNPPRVFIIPPQPFFLQVTPSSSPLSYDFESRFSKSLFSPPHLLTAVAGPPALSPYLLPLGKTDLPCPHASPPFYFPRLFSLSGQNTPHCIIFARYHSVLPSPFSCVSPRPSVSPHFPCSARFSTNGVVIQRCRTHAVNPSPRKVLSSGRILSFCLIASHDLPASFSLVALPEFLFTLVSTVFLDRRFPPALLDRPCGVIIQGISPHSPSSLSFPLSALTLSVPSCSCLSLHISDSLLFTPKVTSQRLLPSLHCKTACWLRYCPLALRMLFRGSMTLGCQFLPPFSNHSRILPLPGLSSILQGLF